MKKTILLLLIIFFSSCSLTKKTIESDRKYSPQKVIRNANKNINIKSLKKNNIPIYMTIEDELIFDNFRKNFKLYFSKDCDFELHLIDDFQINDLILSAAHLSIYGWKKEAIPTVKAKTSLITRIFKSIFE